MIERGYLKLNAAMVKGRREGCSYELLPACLCRAEPAQRSGSNKFCGRLLRAANRVCAPLKNTLPPDYTPTLLSLCHKQTNNTGDDQCQLTYQHTLQVSCLKHRPYSFSLLKHSLPRRRRAAHFVSYSVRYPHANKQTTQISATTNTKHRA